MGAQANQITSFGAGRFTVLQELGRGGFGSVYRVRDERTGAEVALKHLRVSDPSALMAFKQEFRSLARVHHANLVALFELHRDDAHGWFFTMEYVDGRPLLTHLHGSDASISSSGLRTLPPESIHAATSFQVTSSLSLPPAETLRPGPEWLSKLPPHLSGTDSNVAFDLSRRELDPKRMERTHPESYARESGALESNDLPDLDSDDRDSDDRDSGDRDSGDRDSDRKSDNCESNVADGEPRAPLEHRRATPVQNFAELRRVLNDLASAIAWLHDHGKLHGDIKPFNVIVDRNGRVTVLDFGLVQELGGAFGPGRDRALVGTPAYIAPELLRGQPPTPSSDWYSFGALLFEALVGRRPFEGSVHEVLDAKLMHAAPRASDLADGIPADLDALCVALLAPSPVERPDSATIQRVILANASDRESRSGATGFVGRTTELLALEECLLDAKAGQTTLALVSGVSGMGKSAVVERFLARHTEAGAWTIAARCYENESVPYKALDGILDALTRRLGSLSYRELHDLLPEGMGALARLFPVLHALEPVQVGGIDQMDQRPLLRAAARAFRKLLTSLAQSRTLILVIDDLQWGDTESLMLLTELLRGAPPLLFIAIYRSDEADTSPFLKRFLAPDGPAALPERKRRISIEPLAPRDAITLVRTLRADVADLESLIREAAGSPLFLGELVDHVSRTPRAANQPLILENVILDRVRALPPTARAYLEVAAVAGLPIAESLVRASGDLPALSPLERQLLVNGRFIRVRNAAEGDEIETSHDRVREAVLDAMPATRRCELHTHLARTLEHVHAEAGLIVEHFLAAGTPERALAHLEIAGERASRSLAFDRAAKYFRLALRHSPQPSLHLHIQFAESLRNAGRGPDAAAAFLRAADRAPADRALELKILATEQFLFAAEYEAGLGIMTELLERFGISPATTMAGLLSELAIGTLRLRLRGLELARYPSEDRDKLRRIQLLRSATIGLSMAEPLRAQVVQKRYLLEALDAGDPKSAIQALGVELAFSAFMGGHDERYSQALSVQARSLANRTHDLRGRGFIVLSEGAVDWQRGRWPDAHRRVTEAAEIFRKHCVAATWELDTAQIVGLDSLISMGRMRELRVTLPDVIADATERNDRYLEAHVVTRSSWFVELAEDRPNEARRSLDAIMARWTAPGFHVVHFWELLGRASVRIYDNDGPKALEILAKGAWPLRYSLMLTGQYYRALWLDLRARAYLTCAAAEPSPARRRTYSAQAERYAKRLSDEGMPWTIALATSLFGGLAWVRDRRCEARSHFARAAEHFAMLSMTLHEASARLRVAELSENESGVADSERARAIFAQEDIASPERFAALLCPAPHRIRAR